MTITKLIQQIRAILEQGRNRDLEEGKKLARQYKDACDKAAERLGQCSTYLAKSMLSEALQVAESNPPLLDLVGTLDFIGIEDWRSLCEDEGWPRPAAFDEHQISQLNEAYANAASIEPLLKEFRRAVREQRTVDCLRMLRGLISLQPDNESWKTDLVAFEKRRLEEIRAALGPLKQAGDEEGLSRLAVELSEKWSIGNVSFIRDEVQKHLNSLRSAREAVSGRRLLSEIASAYSALDLDRAGPLIARYQKLLQSPYYAPPPESAGQLAEAEDWYKSEKRARLEQQEFEAAVARLQTGVEKRDLPAIEEAFIDLSRSKLDIPPNLERLGRNLLEDARIEKNRRRKRLVLVCLIVMAGALSSAAFLYIQREIQLQVELASGQLQDLYDSLDVVGFHSRLDRLEVDSPWVYRADSIQGWVRRRPELERLRADREAEFERVIARLEGVHEARFVDMPAAFDRWVEEARILALTALDLNRVSVVVEAWSDERERRQRVLDDTILGVLSSVESQLAAFVANITDHSTEQALNRLAVMRSEASDALEPADLSSGIRARGQRLLAQIATHENRIQSREQQIAALGDTRSLGSYLEAINIYVEAFPDDELARNLIWVHRQARLYQDFTRTGRVNPPQASIWHDVQRTVDAWRTGSQGRWGDVQRRIMALRDDQDMVDLSVADPLRGARHNTYVRGRATRETRRTHGIIQEVFGAHIYQPTPADRVPTFSFQVIDHGFRNKRPMAHIQFVSDLTSAVRFATPSDGYDILLGQIQTLQRQPGISSLLRLRLLVMLVNELKALSGDAEIPEWDAFLREASRVPADLHWLCIANRDVIRANAEAERIIERHLVTGKAVELTRFRRAFYTRLASARIQWAGRTAFDGRPDIVWSTPQPIESLLVIRNTERGVPEVRLAQERRDGRLRRYVELLPGEPVFYLAGDQTMRDILMDSMTDARVRTADISSFPWPRVWLVNLRP